MRTIVLTPKFENGNFSGYNQVDGNTFFDNEGVLYPFVTMNDYNTMHQAFVGQIHELEDQVRELKLNVIQEKSKQQTAQIVTHPNGEEIGKGLIEFGFNKAVKALKDDICHNQPEITDWLDENKGAILR